MNNETVNYTASFEFGRGTAVCARVHWEAYQAAAQAIKEMEADLNFEPGELSSDEYEVATYGFENRIQCTLWDELQKMYPVSPHIRGTSQRFNENTLSLVPLDMDVFAPVRTSSDVWEDTAVIRPNRTAVRKIRIMERANAQPAVFEGDFQISEGEFEYAGNFSPKRVSSRKVRISERRQLKPNIFPGEFEDLDRE